MNSKENTIIIGGISFLIIVVSFFLVKQMEKENKIRPYKFHDIIPADPERILDGTISKDVDAVAWP